MLFKSCEMRRCASLGSGSDCRENTTIGLEESDCYWSCCRTRYFDEQECQQNNLYLQAQSQKMDQYLICGTSRITQSSQLARSCCCSSSSTSWSTISNASRRRHPQRRKCRRCGSRPSTRTTSATSASSTERLSRPTAAITSTSSASNRPPSTVK